VKDITQESFVGHTSTAPVLFRARR